MWGDILQQPTPSEWRDTVAAVAGHIALTTYPTSLTDVLLQTWHVEVNRVCCCVRVAVIASCVRCACVLFVVFCVLCVGCVLCECVCVCVCVCVAVFVSEHRRRSGRR